MWEMKTWDENSEAGGPICTVKIQRFSSAIIRSAKGHKFKMERGVETVVPEIEKGLECYIAFWAGKRKTTAELLNQLECWKTRVLGKITQELFKSQHQLYPTGTSLNREMERIAKSITFLKEDRAPHVMVAMCKRRYQYELWKEMNSEDTF